MLTLPEDQMREYISSLIVRRASLFQTAKCAYNQSSPGHPNPWQPFVEVEITATGQINTKTMEKLLEY